METSEIYARLQQHFGSGVILGHTPAGEGIKDPFVTVVASRIDKVCLFCRVEADLAFDFFQTITGLDTGDTLTCVYHLYSYTHRHTLVLKTGVSRQDPRLPTCTRVWPAADWYEREVYDLFGVAFEGHPDLRRLLLPEDWVGYPMRKDYKEEAEYRPTAAETPLHLTVPTTRENPLDLLDAEPAEGKAG